MPGHVGVTAVHLRIKVIGLDHRHLGIIRHQQLRDTAEEGEGGIVARDPVGELLVESLASRLSLNISHMAHNPPRRHPILLAPQPGNGPNDQASRHPKLCAINTEWCVR
jgi:hypothetical protein